MLPQTNRCIAAFFHRFHLDYQSCIVQKLNMAAKDYPLAAAAPAANSPSTPHHVCAFDLGKASLGQARLGTRERAIGSNS
jgi:hypothetical protein